ncbi:MAG: hypothetical protein K0S24_5056 [Sphingobacterium sp.]|nr:hypothetical protein [Sphingobacterium sp.]
MRKILYLLFVFCLTISLVGCGERTAKTEEDILGIITKELDLDVSVQKIGTINLDDVVLVSYMTGNEYQAHTYGYAEFEKQKDNCKFLRTYSMMERGIDLRSALYNDSYLFVINNDNCKSIRISFKSGNEKLIIVDKIPFVYYLENALDSNFEYHFLNKYSEEISL